MAKKIRVTFNYNYKVPEKFYEISNIFIANFKIRGFGIIQIEEIKERPKTVSDTFASIDLEDETEE